MTALEIVQSIGNMEPAPRTVVLREINARYTLQTANMNAAAHTNQDSHITTMLTALNALKAADKKAVLDVMDGLHSLSPAARSRVLATIQADFGSYSGS